MTEFIKSKIKWTNSICNKQQNDSRNCADYNVFQKEISEVSKLLVDDKNRLR